MPHDLKVQQGKFNLALSTQLKLYKKNICAIDRSYLSNRTNRSPGFSAQNDHLAESASRKGRILSV